MSVHKKRTITVEIEEGDTEDALFRKVQKEADREMIFHNKKKAFMERVNFRKKNLTYVKNRVVSDIICDITMRGGNNNVLGIAQFIHREITEELNSLPKELREYIVETTDVYYPLQYHDTKKAVLREIFKDATERVEHLEEKDL